jgi:hypothetical protein
VIGAYVQNGGSGELGVTWTAIERWIVIER